MICQENGHGEMQVLVIVGRDTYYWCPICGSVFVKYEYEDERGYMPNVWHRTKKSVHPRCLERNVG